MKTCNWRWTPSPMSLTTCKRTPHLPEPDTMTDVQNTPRYAALDAWIDAHFDDEVRFLQALVQVPTDTPPGNNAPHAERTAELLQAFGYEAEKHPVPAAEVQAYGMQSITNLIVRRPFGPAGSGRTIALNAHGDVVPRARAGPTTPRAPRSWTARCMAAPRPSARAISRASPSPCALWRPWPAPPKGRWSCTSPTTKSLAANWARAGC